MIIDLVYTYINGNDTELSNTLSKLMHEDEKKINPTIRYEQINEINYSIKTALKFVGWINNIFIVTDNQIPNLDDDIKENTKIKIIQHKDIIPEIMLPVFYSDVIESYLHNIPGLSEVFIYNNDDCIFLDYIKKTDIYDIDDKGNIRLKIITHFNIDIIKKKTSEYSQRILYTAKILNNLGCYNLINNHHSKILLKSTMKLIENKYSILLNQLRKHKFRNIESIQYLFFVLNIDNLNNNNIILKSKNNCIEYHFGNTNYNENNTTITNRFNYKKVKFACYNSMNDTYTDVFIKLINTAMSM